VARLGETRLEGRWSAELAGPGRPRVLGELRSQHVRLEDLGLGAARAEGGAAAEGAPAWASREPFPVEGLRLLYARLALEAARLTAGSSVDLRDASAAVELEDGDLRVSELRLAYQGGRVAGALRLDARAAAPEIALRLDATALDLARLGEALGRRDEAGSGELDLALDLRSGGDSPAALWPRLSGRLALALRDWSAAGTTARRFLMDLRRAFVGSRSGAPERVGCLMGAVAFESGVGTVETLVLTGPAATVVGRGRIDLARERWDLELAPELHDPGLFVVAAAVRVTGPLDAPRFQPVPLDLVSGALRSVLGAALRPARAATGGAQRLLGPAGKILAPVTGAIGLASGDRPAAPAVPCAVPAAPAR
jgi:uncharacterized protein involved in outer membrane biogenesis